MLEIFAAVPGGQALATLFVAMLPFIELRGAIPVGVALGLSPELAFLLSLLGNMLPVPFIILFARHIFRWLTCLDNVIGRVMRALETRVHNKSDIVIRYRTLGLCLLVAIPLPGTGAWTGAMVAALLDMPLRSALPAIALGVLIAGVIILSLTYGVISIF